jgi:hypothetical protein
MNYFDLYSSYPDPTIAAAWDSQVKEAEKTSWLADSLAECGDELFARFAARYAELRALPRAARRALQRRIARSNELTAILPEYPQQGGRRLRQKMAWSLAGAALLLALGQGAASAATITVTTNNPNVISDGKCSLIEAIVNANNDAATFPDCQAGSGADTIVLPANANLTLSAVNHGDPWGVRGLPAITSRITIEGNGATIARQGNAPAFGLIAVMAGDLTLQSVTLSGGSSSESGDIGGGVFNFGTLSIKNSTISGNTAGERSGGVDNFYGILTIENSTISDNVAAQGGGISNISGSLTITNSTMSGNIARGDSNIKGAANAGGGLLNTPLYGYCNYFDSCSPATLTLTNSLIAGNHAAVAPEIENVGSIVNANNFNLFGTNGNAGVSGFTPGPTDIVPSVSLTQIMSPLKNNGGPTQTHALVAGSPAIDAGNPNGCLDSTGAPLPTDQRGFRRNVDGNNDGTARCDIGAVEFAATPVAAPVDFDGDGKSDIGIYRDGVWSIMLSSDEILEHAGWGGTSWLPVSGDYDGDGKADIAVYNPIGVWSIVRSSDSGNTVLGWGGPGWEPVQADYDGDGKADIAVYNPIGVWSIVRSSDGGNTVLGWGGPGWEPVQVDYDGDGKADIAVYNPIGVWSIVRSSDGGNTVIGWGGPAWTPVPGDYDGDGKADIAVYDANGFWSILRSSDGQQMVISLGGDPQDILVPADYDGDGKTDAAIYRNGSWIIKRSSDGATTVVNLGGAEDIPLN